MRKFTAFLLVFSILLLSGNLFAKERKGAELYIQKKDGHYERGELITVKKKSLLLKDYVSGADVSVDIEDVRKITIMRKSKAGKGALIGLAVGAFVGVASAGAEEAGASGSSGIGFNPSTGTVMAFAGIVVGGLGALIGAAIGAAAGKDATIQIEGKSDAEIQEILEKLGKKARVCNVQ